MRIYIHTDLEGVSEVATFEQTRFASPDIERMRAALVYDTNAAIEGAFDAGADEVYVLDAHNGGGNMDVNLLDKRAVFDVRGEKNPNWYASLDDSFDGTFFIGAHAMAGTQNAFLEHTQSSTSWYNYYVNGKKYGELGQWAMVAGHFGVPFIMMSGDDAAVTEARNFFGDIECVSVKYAKKRNLAELYDVEQSRKKIKEAAYRAVRDLKEGKRFKVFKPCFPAEIKLELFRSDMCDDMCKDHPWVERLDGRTVRYVIDSPLQLFFKEK